MMISQREGIMQVLAQWQEVALCFLPLPSHKSSSEKQSLFTPVAMELTGPILASRLLPDSQCPPHHRVQYVGPCTLSWLKLAGYTGPLRAPAQTLKSQLCWELWSSSGLLSPSPFVIMFNPTDTCLGFETLLIKRDEKTFLSICIQILQINTAGPWVITHV